MIFSCPGAKSLAPQFGQKGTGIFASCPGAKLEASPGDLASCPGALTIVFKNSTAMATSLQSGVLLLWQEGEKDQNHRVYGL